MISLYNLRLHACAYAMARWEGLENRADLYLSMLVGEMSSKKQAACRLLAHEIHSSKLLPCHENWRAFVYTPVSKLARERESRNGLFNCPTGTSHLSSLDQGSGLQTDIIVELNKAV